MELEIAKLLQHRVTNAPEKRQQHTPESHLVRKQAVKERKKHKYNEHQWQWRGVQDTTTTCNLSQKALGGGDHNRKKNRHIHCHTNNIDKDGTDGVAKLARAPRMNHFTE